MRRTLTAIVFGAVLHAALTLVVGMFSLGSVMRGFDEGGPPSHSVLEAGFDVALDILRFPLLTPSLPIAVKTGSTELQYGILFANGMLWSGTLILLWKVLRRSRVTLRRVDGAAAKVD